MMSVDFVDEHVPRIDVDPVLLADEVGDPAAVGVEEAAQEMAGMSGNDFPLPISQHDRPVVLLARPVLRQQARPMRPIALDTDATLHLYPLHGGGEGRPHRRFACVDE
jgi:hypothetical protein